ncbi:putative lipase ROG1 [Aristolochia californica]|uniref:putative lipase ROG1 n=1 Tax=Aristolochia californica TaxID=171875 RepID=UPI0035D93C37
MAIANPGERSITEKDITMVKTKKKKKRKTSSYFPKPDCCRLSFKEKELETSGGLKPSLEIEAVMPGGVRMPTHLVVFVNGIIGSSSNWKFAAKQLVKRFPEDILAHCSEANTGTQTLDGVDFMGKRLAEEIISVTTNRPELQKISIVSHSLGGLIARYAIAILYAQNYMNKENGEHYSFNSRSQGVAEKSKETIAGLEPINFITFATPHAGCRGHRQIPMAGGIRFFEKVAYHSSWICRRTGEHLFFKDSNEGLPPLLLQMVYDSDDLKFISALRSFRRRAVYSNSCFDHIVGWSTASIRLRHELPKLQHLPKDDKYPHVVNIEAPKTTSIEEELPLESALKNKDKEEIESAIIRNLNKMSWERVDVSFQSSKQRFFAHSTIQVKTYCINSDGADVVFHMIDNFLL